MERAAIQTVQKEAPVIEPIAVSIPQAAQIVGVSRAKFYQHWINGGLVQPVDLGARGRSVRLDELRAAVQTLAQQQRQAG